MVDGRVCDVKFDKMLGVLLSFDYCVSGILLYFSALIVVVLFVLLFLHGPCSQHIQEQEYNMTSNTI